MLNEFTPKLKVLARPIDLLKTFRFPSGAAILLMLVMEFGMFSVMAQEQAEPQFTTDIPEEVLENELILDGRSPIDGQPLSPAEYAQLEDQLQQVSGEVPGRLSPKVQQAVVLLRLRKVITTLFPFF